MERRGRVGLVLGGGGVRGASWLMGALHGLIAETGWDPAGAELLIGTSAGATVAALTAAGARPWHALAPERHDFLRALMEAAAFRPELTLRSLAPGSPALARTAWRSGPSAAVRFVAGILPEGFVSTRPIARLVQEHAPGGWPAHPGLWIVATDYLTGDRVAFGRDGAPAAELADAVAASCAIPGFYRPVPIGGRRYVDGALHSGANLDLAAAAGLDLVVCLNPLSSPVGAATGPAAHLRELLHRQLAAQVRAVEEAGCRVLVIEPVGRSIDLIGLNPMSRGRVAEIGRAAAEEVAQALRERTRPPLDQLFV